MRPGRCGNPEERLELVSSARDLVTGGIEHPALEAPLADVEQAPRRPPPAAAGLAGPHDANLECRATEGSSPTTQTGNTPSRNLTPSR
jgi:hypothetical protein